MLRLLLLGLFLTLTALKPLTADLSDGSGDYATDDEPDESELVESSSGTGVYSENTERGNIQKQGSHEQDGTTTIIIIAAVSVVALAIVAVLAVLLFRRHLKSREQGVYAVPVDQVEKDGI